MPPINVTVAGVNDHLQLVGACRLVSIRLNIVAVVPILELDLKPAIGRNIVGVMLK